MDESRAPLDANDQTGDVSRSVLITGATGGIGATTVEALLAKGFRVWAAAHDDRSRQQLRERFGDSVRTLAFDVTDSLASRRPPRKSSPQVHFWVWSTMPAPP